MRAWHRHANTVTDKARTVAATILSINTNHAVKIRLHESPYALFLLGGCIDVRNEIRVALVVPGRPDHHAVRTWAIRDMVCLTSRL